MLDINHLPNSNKVIQQVFHATAQGGRLNWNIWNKPRGINYVHIFALAGGGGGAAGTVGANGSLGGGGGGSSAIFSSIFSAFSLPNNLYFSVGTGGVGGSVSGASGNAGVNTNIALYGEQVTGGSPTTQNIIATVAGGSGASAAAAGGAGSATAVSAMFTGLNCFGSSGQTGTKAGSAGSAANANVEYRTSSCVMGGAGGGTLPASSFAVGGGTLWTNGTFNQYFPRHLGGQSSGENGSHGFKLPNLLFFYGGTGGASGTASTIGVGGRGGDGSHGCGGGGGGAAFTGSQVGRGGNGGPGIVIVTCW